MDNNSTKKEVVFYTTVTGKIPLNEWLKSFKKDYISRGRIEARLDMLEYGHYGDYKSVGNGVIELRFYFGAGYRVYFAEEDNRIIVLLYGGDKSSQRRDIAKAKEYWQDYQNR